MLVERGTARLEFSDGIFAIASTVLLEISVLAGSGTTVCVRSLTSDPRIFSECGQLRDHHARSMGLMSWAKWPT